MAAAAVGNTANEVPDIAAFDLTDPTLFADDRFMSVLDRLRSDDPVHFHPEPDGPGFWVVTRHDDASRVYADDDSFSSRLGMRLGADADAVEAVADRMLIVSDQPQHARIRRLVGSAFTPPVMHSMVESVRGVVAELMDAVITGEPCEFVSAVARPLPTHVICAFMGLPRVDWERIGLLTTDGIDSQDDGARRAANSELFFYFTKVIQERRSNPGTDLISTLIRTADEAKASDGAKAASTDTFSALDLVVNLAGILIGANETTRYAIAGGLIAFAQHPEQWRMVQSNPDLVATAAEEILRWTSPAVHAMRTVTKETRLGNRTLKAGDRVTIWTPAVNRDPEAFPHPGRFDVTRRHNRHLAFGHGRHICVGARLARLEITAVLDQLRTRVADIHLLEAPQWSPSNFTRGPVRMLTRLDRAAR